MTETQPPALALCADAGAAVGLGHVARCLSLAEAWRASGKEASLIVPEGVADVAVLAEPRSIQVQAVNRERLFSAEGLARIAGEARVGWIALDGYAFDNSLQLACRQRGKRVLVVDDDARQPEFAADVLVNSEPGAERLSYRVAAGGLVLLGPKYALLRSEFRAHRGNGHRRVPIFGHRVLVSLGGGDVSDALRLVVAALMAARTPRLEARILRGPLSGAAPSGDLPLCGDPQLRCLPPTNDMPGLMSWADAAILGGGGTSIEAACMGLPALLLELADNQHRSIAALAAAGVAESLGSYRVATTETIARALDSLLGDVRRRSRLAATGSALVDGRGAERIVSAMLTFQSGP